MKTSAPRLAPITFATLLVAVFVLAMAEPANADTCSPQTTYEGGCTITSTVTTDTVDLTATDTSSTPTTTSPRTTPRGTPPPVTTCSDPASTTCYRPVPATVTAPVTVADIASFRPMPPVDHMEPDGWTVAGLATNFFATGGRHVVDGVLLGSAAQVRFTPVYWSWTYGDGASAGHPFPGGTWAAQGVREFDATATSHVYAERGTYTIDLVVEYAAEYRYAGSGWVDVVGTVILPANRLVITAGGARTVLVERECTRNPAGPGC